MPPELLNPGAAGAPVEDSITADLEKAWSNVESGAEPERPADAGQPDAAATAERPADTRARDEQGRFARAQQDAAAAQQQDPGKAPAQAQQPGQQQPTADAQAQRAGPPPGWSVPAKQAYDALPQPVKEAIAKREEEVSRGLAKLAEWKDVEPFRELAAQHGTTVAKALDAYVAAERLLATNPVQGFKFLADKFQVDLRQVAQLIYGGGAQPGRQQPGNANGGHQPPPAVLAPLFQEVQALKTAFARQQEAQTAQQRSRAESEIMAFAADPANKWFENVLPEMTRLYQSGQARSLKEAYETACWTNPEVRAALISEQTAADIEKRRADANAAAASARRAAGSITGSPSAGASPAGGPEPDTITDALEAAWSRTMGGVR